MNVKTKYEPYVQNTNLSLKKGNLGYKWMELNYARSTYFQ